MKSCDQTQHMQNTGAQAAIGPLPRWSSAFVIEPNYRLFRWMKANTDALGAYNIHYRERKTGRPLSITAHPCATRVSAAELSDCPVAPHADDRFPKCDSDCDSPLNPNIAHHPAPAYVAYLATGDWYYETELVFWANWTIFWQNPKYREFAKGLMHDGPLRAQGWTLRSLGDAAYLLPDDAPKKSYFNQVVSNNIAWYNKRYTRNPDANKLGAVASYGSVIYPSDGNKRTAIATWQQSFFTWAIGNLVYQGFDGAKPLLDWVSQFQVGLMTAPGFCWELAPSYNLRIRDTREAPYYNTFAEVYAKSFPKLKDAGCAAKPLNAAIKRVQGKKHFHYPPGTMVGYPKSGTGFPANFQIGLAAAADSDAKDAAKAWSIFIHRRVQPDYTTDPQFAVLPRHWQGGAQK